ncbi:ribonuclease Z [Niabella ginsenosidivorans]|uniref:Ribonuclease Z n=1 Tax=Niabella ginsenosidivorans TaxID=1176587 RepID=A0A1A9I7A9_9BACT|nr:ribonuclease Z [Niabella ginsenosidivorans]ANH82542.1 ribonuclease Z [Niabella ginsenosidivorans]
MLGVIILGNNSAVPAFDRHPTSQLLTMPNRKFLIDCGEGTQIQLIRYKIRRSRISHIFISHLHGDHYFGLAGLLNSFSLLGRQQELHVSGPAGLQEILEMQFRAAHTEMAYPLYFHTIRQAGYLMTVDDVEISCFKTDHRIECYGFVFREKKNPRSIDPEAVKKHNIQYSWFETLQQGKDYKAPDGSIIRNELLTFEAPKGKTYAFCADTKYDESFIPDIKDADMIYHETTYLENFRDQAVKRFHSTSKQAALIAQKAHVKKLLIGHFSSRYDELDDFQKEAREIFPNTDLALEGVCYRMP